MCIRDSGKADREENRKKLYGKGENHHDYCGGCNYRFSAGAFLFWNQKQKKLYRKYEDIIRSLKEEHERLTSLRVAKRSLKIVSGGKKHSEKHRPFRNRQVS